MGHEYTDHRHLPNMYHPVQAYYIDHNQHEDDSRKVAWCSKYDQELRLMVLLEASLGASLVGAGGQFHQLHHHLQAKNGQKETILDVGCGLGALVDLLERNQLPLDYLGVDILPHMVEGATVRHPGYPFQTVDILREPLAPQSFDHVLCSGTLSVAVAGNHKAWAWQMVRAMFKLAKKSLAFNLQTIRGLSPDKSISQGLFYADPIEWYTGCRKMCSHTILREDFLSSDFAISMFKGPSPSLDTYVKTLGFGLECHDDRLRQEELGYVWLCASQGYFEEALVALSSLKQSDNSSADLLNLEGNCRLHLEDFVGAEGVLRLAVELEPENADAGFNLGVSLEKQGKCDEACKQFGNVLSKHPNHVLAGTRKQKLEKGL